MAVPSSLLDPYRNAELTVDELAEAAAGLLNKLEVRPADGRVAPAPDARGIRYYQTIGIVDHPLRYEGRRAIYGFRHLLQLLAAKQLQQEGQALKLIQQSLSGCPTPVLEQALEAVMSRPGQRPAIETPGPAPVLTFSISPGVTVTVDPTLVSDAEALVHRLAAVTAPSPVASRSHDDKEPARPGPVRSAKEH